MQRPVTVEARFHFRSKSGAGYYGDFVAQVDGCVGQVMKALDEAKLADNTLLIFTSDNGAHWLPEDIEKWGHRANGSLRGQKADVWEGGHRVPFIVAELDFTAQDRIRAQLPSLANRRPDTYRWPAESVK